METLGIVLAAYLGMGVLVAYYTMFTGPYAIRIDTGPFVLWMMIWPVALMARSRAIAAGQVLHRQDDARESHIRTKADEEKSQRTDAS